MGTDYDSGARAAAQKRGAFQRVEGRLVSAIDGADVVILATPVLAMRDLMETLGPELQEGCVLTDVGSSKKDRNTVGRGTAAEEGTVCRRPPNGGP